MRASDLLSPGQLASSQTLRHTVAHAISRAQINASHGNLETAERLMAFFLAASTFVGGDGSLGEGNAWVQFINGEWVLNFDGFIPFEEEIPE